MGSDAMDAVLSRPTEQALKERVGGNATDPKLAAQARRSSDVLARATSHSLKGMGRLGGGWHCLVSPHQASSREAGGR
jgi:hypothetical protein